MRRGLETAVRLGYCGTPRGNGEQQIGLTFGTPRQSSTLPGAGEHELAGTRSHRDRLWQLIYASAFGRSISSEEAQQQSGDSSPLETNFPTQLRLADEIADARYANAKDVGIHDRLVKEIETARRDQAQIAEELVKLENEDLKLRQQWTGEWDGLGFEPLSPLEMKEWMQARQAILDR